MQMFLYNGIANLQLAFMKTYILQRIKTIQPFFLSIWFKLQRTIFLPRGYHFKLDMEPSNYYYSSKKAYMDQDVNEHYTQTQIKVKEHYTQTQIKVNEHYTQTQIKVMFIYFNMCLGVMFLYFNLCLGVMFLYFNLCLGVIFI